MPLNGLFLGKSLTPQQNCQKIIFDVDRLIVSHEGFGLVGNLAYQISWLDGQGQNKGYFRQIFAPRNRLLDLLQNENDFWEAYIIDTKGVRQGSISTTNWDWAKNLPQNWHSSAMFQFTKL